MGPEGSQVKILIFKDTQYSQVGKKLWTLSVYSTEKGSPDLGGERVETLQSGRSGSWLTLALTSSPVGITLLAQLNCCSM